MPGVTVLEFDIASALASGGLRAHHHRQGTPSGYADALIAGTAVAYDLILVTRNVRHFEGVSGLNLENWFE